jgi:fructokinase
MPRILVLGEALIDLFAGTGVSLRTTRAFQPTPGGAPANVAVALGKLGADVGFIGKVGQDEFGLWLRQFMASQGVDVAYLEADSRAPTMLAVVALPTPDNPQFILYNGANELLTPDELPQQAIAQAAVFIYGSVTLSTRSGEAALHAAHIAHQAGATVIFDVNLRPNLWPDLETARREIDRCLDSATIIKANENEIQFLTGTDDLERGSAALLERGAKVCCVSLGDQGAYFRTARAGGYVPAFKVNAIDATGSGDAFVAGLALQVAALSDPFHDLSFEGWYERFRFANACGALTTTVMGGMNGSPLLADVQAFMRTQ